MFFHEAYKLRNPDDIDRIISAEIPNKEEHPDLYELIREFMMHGPCGDENPSCPCMKEGKCSKNFPKELSDCTTVDEDGFPIYTRRNNGNTITKGKANLDNRSVVPYNKVLLKSFQAHINVEWCNQLGSIKYLFKYINKGPDRITISVTNDSIEDSNLHDDEIKNYYNCRYISACEATWRIFCFDVHYRTPSV